MKPYFVETTHQKHIIGRSTVFDTSYKQVCRWSLWWNIWWKKASPPGCRWCTVISPSSHTFPQLIVQDWILMRSVSDLLPFSVTAGDGGSRLLWWRRRRPPPHPPSQGAYKKNRWVQRKKKGGGRFGSWGPSSLFRHSLFSPSKNTSEAASLPAHGASEFHSILLAATQSDLRSCLIYCTSR